jgi:acyl carrier protein
MTNAKDKTAMVSKERVTNAVFRAVDELNQQLPLERRVAKSMHTLLLDGAGGVDSLELINLIVTTEQKIAAEFGAEIILTEDAIITEDTCPFRSLGDLTDYITMLLEEKIK